MGCASSKRVEATVAAADVYQPAATSFARFDINTIEEPWLKAEQQQQHEEQDQQQQQKSITLHVPVPILEKLNKFELEPNGPHSWSEVSKVLEDLKPSLHNQTPPSSKPEPVHHPVQDSSTPVKKPLPTPKKSPSFHTLEELESNLSSNSSELNKLPQLKKTESRKFGPKKTESELSVVTKPDSIGYKPVKENLFVLRDRLEREKGEKNPRLDWMIGLKTRRDPLSEFPDKCPPGGLNSVVLYTTTLHGVRRTFEDCNRVRSVIEGHRVVFDERDVSLHGEFLNELRELLGEGVSVPRLFVKGRYIGGVDEVVELNESTRLSELLNSVGIERGLGFQACEGCGGGRFVPCWECGGSCKVLVGNKKERCPTCNENGLVQCPVCH
ncbi:Glutaredoxin [Macleaya cordata]|uniref:Glutaredoxin n=1 Tax=Macleaya cordata TaxID=56857 RepID=A0A200QCR1_MACCD|nr:Glutaredoxin [Macleaya cordata]